MEIHKLILTVAISHVPDSVGPRDEIVGGGDDVQVVLLCQHILACHAILGPML
jgi:hypothetical protein